MKREPKRPEHQQTPSYELLYMALHLDDNAELLASAEEIGQQADEIRALTEAIEELEGYVPTYSST